MVSLRLRRLWSRTVRNPTVLGGLTGCFLTILVYLAFTRSLSVRWSSSSDGNLFIRRPIFLSGEEHSLSDSYSGSSEHPLSGTKSFERKLLLEVVATSRNELQLAVDKVNTNWGQGVEHWTLAIGTADEEMFENGDNLQVLEASKCHDFVSDGYMSASQLFCLLKAVYRSHHSNYRWFIIGQNSGTEGSIYIAVRRLERLLSGLDPDMVIYVGECGTGLTGRSGIVLSHAALRLIVPHLHTCLEEGGVVTGAGDEALEACFEAKLQKSCYDWDQPAGSFVNGFQGITMATQARWMETHGHFLTVFPVRTSEEMQALHIADLMRELEYQREEVRTRTEKLSASPLCRLETARVNLDPPQHSTELNSWQVANPNSTYISNHLEPRYWYDGDIRMEIETAAKRGLAQTNKRNGTDYEFRRVMYAYYRSRGTDGREVIVDVETTSKAIVRMRVLRPYLFAPILLEDAGVEAINKMIDFIVPLSNVRSRFAEFMKTYEDVCLKFGENCRLNLVIYGKQDLEIIKSNLTAYKSKYPDAQFNLIPGEGKFSRGRALRTGMSTLPKSALAFTCDVDMTIDRSFLNHCRRNAIEGRRVYYPEVFKYYDMAYVYRFEPKPLFGYDISRKHGHWCTYGYGMLCIYKSDYDMVGGYDEKIEGWGGEDIQLIDDVIDRGLEVMRAPDPALSHRYHPKVCSSKLTKAQYSQCVTSRNEDIADRRRLADYIYYLENKCKIKKKIWD